MQKLRKVELSFLYVTHLPFLFYISAKYHQNIPKVIPVTEINFKNETKDGNSKSKKARVVILVCIKLSRPVLHFY